jgi:hypothetical protein
MALVLLISKNFSGSDDSKTGGRSSLPKTASTTAGFFYVIVRQAVSPCDDFRNPAAFVNLC